MKIVTSKELAKVPNGSLVLDLNTGKSAAPNEIDLYNDMIPQIFVVIMDVKRIKIKVTGMACAIYILLTVVAALFHF